MSITGTQGSAFLQKIGLGSFDMGYLLIIVAGLAVLVLVLIIVLIVQICKAGALKKRLNKFLVGRDGLSLEQEIIGLCEDNKFLRNATENNRKNIGVLNKKLESAFQKTALIKYDAFSQMGGQLSFCLALLDENDNGFIINSVHSTEGCYFYSKEIRKGESTLSLSREESEALAMAMSRQQV